MAAELIDAIERRFARPFVWGGADCCLAACNVLVDLGFPDPAAAYRGRYSDEDGARAAMGPRGVEGVAEAECARLGWAELDPEKACPLDVGVVANSLALRMDGVWAVKSEDGLALKHRVRRAWRPKC